MLKCPHCQGLLQVEVTAGAPVQAQGQMVLDLPPIPAAVLAHPPKRERVWVLQNNLGRFVCIYNTPDKPTFQANRWVTNPCDATHFKSLSDSSEFNCKNRDMLVYPCESIEVDVEVVTTTTVYKE